MHLSNLKNFEIKKGKNNDPRLKERYKKKLFKVNDKLTIKI